MVDINLIGDDQTQFEPDENEKDFQDAYRGDSGDFSQDTFMRSDSFEPADYNKVIRKGSSKAGVIILFIIVLALLAVTAYILFKPAKTQRIATIDSADLSGEIEVVPPEDTSMTPVEPGMENVGAGDVSEITTTPQSTISPTVLDLIAKSHSGFQIINQLVNSIPPAVDFTMITYSDGKVIFELLSENETAIADIDAVLQQRIPAANLQKVSGGIKPIKGRQYYQALIKGEINSRQLAGQAVSTPPRYLSGEEVKQLISRICEQNNVRFQEMTQGVNKVRDNMAVQPITIRIAGIKNNLLQTLKSMLDENVNLSFVKISLIAREMEPGNPVMTLVLHVNLFQNA